MPRHGRVYNLNCFPFVVVSKNDSGSKKDTAKESDFNLVNQLKRFLKDSRKRRRRKGRTFADDDSDYDTNDSEFNDDDKRPTSFVRYLTGRTALFAPGINLKIMNNAEAIGEKPGNSLTRVSPQCLTLTPDACIFGTMCVLRDSFKKACKLKMYVYITHSHYTFVTYTTHFTAKNTKEDNQKMILEI